MNYIVIALIGSISSGKDTAEKLISEHIFYFGGSDKPLILSTSELLDEEVKNRFPGEPITRTLKQQAASDMEYGNPNFIVDLLYQRIIDCPGETVVAVINSVRTEAQAQRWLELIPDITFIYLHVEDDIRFERYNLREMAAYRQPISREEFDALHEASSDSNISELRKFAFPGNIFDNSFDKHKLVAEINGVMSDIL